MRFLLMNGSSDLEWKMILEDGLAPLGKLDVVKIGDTKDMTDISAEEYGVVIVDATVVEDVEILVSRLRLAQPDCRIVVMTHSPTWQRARSAFEAGAIDYLPKTLSRERLLSSFKQILRKQLPPWPR
jgi:DNA-binding NtrC family response regulator